MRIEESESVNDFSDLKVRCPDCGWEYDDADGLGVYHCEQCGYCLHASATDGVCDYCGKEVYPEQAARYRV